MKKFIYLLCIAVIAVLPGCGDKIKPGAAEVKRPEVKGVTLVKTALSTVDVYYETAGAVTAKATSVISSRTMGAVTEIKVKPGDHVKAGDLLITIDDRDLSQKVSGAEAGYKESLRVLQSADHARGLAQVTYERYRNLYAEKTISRQEMDQIETQKNVADSEYERAAEAAKRAKAALEEARAHHGFSRIVSPVTGVVTVKKVEQGSMALPGAPLMIVEDRSRLRVEAHVDESLSGKFKVGIPAYVIPSGVEGRLTGTIGEISPAVDPQSRTYLVKIDLKGGGLNSGMYAKVLIPEGKKEALLVPKKAVVEKGQLSGVFAVDGSGVMTYRLVKTGRSYGENIEVISGLKQGETIVVGGMEQAIDGGIVKK